MKHITRTLAAALCTLGLGLDGALAAGTHSGGHGKHGSDGHHDAMMAAGKPGKAVDVSRTVQITLKETDSGMAIEPASLQVKQGETIRFEVTNIGEIEHEFVIDTHEKNQEHKELMAKFPEMEHDDPNSVRLNAGEKGEVLWTFSKAGAFEFACLIPGHYESGMHGDVSVGHD